jgi:hypothetical protein
MKPVSIVNGNVTNYWLEFYVQEKCCSLCGNQGIIDTTGLQAPNGKLVGRKNYCICPNGQSMRKSHINSSNDRNVLP